jgi:hypothetical protein
VVGDSALIQLDVHLNARKSPAHPFQSASLRGRRHRKTLLGVFVIGGQQKH